MMTKMAEIEGSVSELKSETNKKTQQLEQEARNAETKAETVTKNLKLLEKLQPAEDGFKSEILSKILYLESSMSEKDEVIATQGQSIKEQTQMIATQGQSI